jgi:uncharacterized RDD family membrane protein YckC
LSTLHSENLFLTWKEEVSRRVAGHISRKPLQELAAHARTETHAAPTGRGARAAARVAARFANAPSYGQMLAEEARAAMRAAKAAQKAAQQAHAAAQMVLAGLEAASSPQPVLDARQPSRRQLASARQSSSEPFDGFARPAADAHDEVPSPVEPDPFAGMRLEPLAELSPARLSAAADETGFGIDSSNKAQPLPANLIQFPREMVAARRMRPRRVEGPLAAAESASQLSIFEVDPQAVSTQPAATAQADSPAAPEWMRPQWPAADSDAPTQEDPIAAPAPRAAAPPIVDLAPFSRRLLATVIDGSLSLAAFLGPLALTASCGLVLRSPRAFGLAAALVFLSICAGYQALCSALGNATPGIWFAGIGICTVDGYVASRAQRTRRLLALPLSILPLGLGLAWALFDEDRLTWHDRLSGTYPRLR